MTRDEFVEKYRHELGGMVLDGCAVNRSGAELGMFARTILIKVQAKLQEMYADLTQAKAEPAKTGTTATIPITKGR